MKSDSVIPGKWKMFHCNSVYPPANMKEIEKKWEWEKVNEFNENSYNGLAGG